MLCQKVIQTKTLPFIALNLIVKLEIKSYLINECIDNSVVINWEFLIFIFLNILIMY
jgi:hypothetical protein